jgi:urease accessory protein
VLHLAYQAASNLEMVARVDAEVEAFSLARDLREASRRAGRALLRVHAQLGTGNAAAYLERIRVDQAHGHVPIVQGLVGWNLTLNILAVEALAGHLLSVALVSAAVRLGCITHIEGQQVLGVAHATLADVLQHPAPVCLSAFAPMADIAMLRHEVQTVRLFAS